MINEYKNNFYVERYLCPYNNEYGQTNHLGFLQAQYNYDDDEYLKLGYDSYLKLKDLLENKYSIIIGEGGIGKSVFLSQIEEYLEKNNIPYKRVNLRDLSNETKLFDKIQDFCNTNSSGEIFILFDAIDEAIDIGIKNVSAVINDAIDKALQINTYIKIILTCRENQLPTTQLIRYLNNLYQIQNEDEKYIYRLCRLSENNVKTIARYNGISNTEQFIEKIKSLNLGVFASSPNMITPLIILYKQKKLNKNICQYDLFEYFMEILTRENDFRNEKDKIGEIKLYSTDKILFVASRIAILLKINNQNLLSDNINIGFCIENLYNDGEFYIKQKHKTYEFNKDIVSAVLKTKLFIKTYNGWMFAQKTYQDFLVARYLDILNLNKKEYKKLLIAEGIIHPNYVDSLAYLASKNKCFFDFILSKNPKDIIYSSIYFTDNTQRIKLFKKYIQLIKKQQFISNNGYIEERTRFHQLIYSKYIDKYIKNYLNSKNKELKIAALLLVIDNKLSDFEQLIKKIIFNKNENMEIKEYALLACKICNYNNIFKEIYDNISVFEKESKEYAIKVISCLYPNYISTEELLEKLKTIDINQPLNISISILIDNLKNNINSENIDIIFNWIFDNQNNKTFYEKSTCYSKLIKKINKIAAENISENIIKKCASLCFRENHHSYIDQFSMLFESINNNITNKNIFIQEIIRLSQTPQQVNNIMCYNPIKLDTDVLILLMSTHQNTNDRKKQSIIKSVVDSEYGNFLDNNKIDDIGILHDFFEKNPQAKQIWGYFLEPINLNPVTLEPVSGMGISMKKNFFDLKKYKQENAHDRVNLDKQIIFYNNTKDRIDEILEKYTNTKNINLIKDILKYLNIEDNTASCRGDTHFSPIYYNKWKNIDGNQKEIITQIAYEYIKNGKTNLPQIIAFIEVLKPKISQVEYHEIINKWGYQILNCGIYAENELDKSIELKIKQNEVKEIDEDVLINNILKIIKDDNICYNFFLDIEVVWSDKLGENLFNILNENTLNLNIKKNIIEFLIKMQYSSLKDKLMDVMENFDIKLDNIEYFVKIITVLLTEYRINAWRLVKDKIYKSEYFERILIVLENTHFSPWEKDNLFKCMDDDDLVELYKNISKKFPEVYIPYPTESVFTPDSKKEMFNGIANYFINYGKEKSLKKIKKEYLKSCRPERKNLIYNNVIQRVRRIKSQNHSLDINLFKNLENKYLRRKIVQIGKYNINGDNHGGIHETNQVANNKWGVIIFVLSISILLLILIIMWKLGLLDVIQIKNLFNTMFK